MGPAKDNLQVPAHTWKVWVEVGIVHEYWPIIKFKMNYVLMTNIFLEKGFQIFKSWDSHAEQPLL